MGTTDSHGGTGVLARPVERSSTTPFSRELSICTLRNSHRTSAACSSQKDSVYENHEIHCPTPVRCLGGRRLGLLPRTLPARARDKPGHSRNGSRESAAFARRE